MWVALMVLGGKEHAEMAKLNSKRVVVLAACAVLVALVLLGALLNQLEPQISVDKADFNKALVATFQEMYAKAGVDDYKASLGEDGSLRFTFPPGGLTEAQKEALARIEKNEMTDIFKRHLALKDH
jgi:hypothetical protein